ncbi:MAG: hypothetical protein ABI548_09130 [Polyangiaceae bacterium]
MKNRGPGVALLALAGLGGCGGVAALPGTSGATSTEPQDAAPGAAAGAGSIDTSAQPVELAMTCPAAAGSVSLSLPCAIGGGGLDVTECELSGAQDNATRLPPISFIVPLGALAKQLNMPLQIPFNNVPAPPLGGYGSLAAYPGEHFSGSLEGTAIFSQVDVASRAFVGRLQQAHFHWVGDQGHSFSCDVVDGPFWALAGNFI